MLKVYGMIAFQFDIHPMLMTIEVDMQNKAKIGSAVCYGLIGKIDAIVIVIDPITLACINFKKCLN